MISRVGREIDTMTVQYLKVVPFTPNIFTTL
jgi:hypothetical protein